MGHYRREMDPKGADSQDKYLDRLIPLREKLRDIPLSEFTVGELEAVMRLMGLFHNSAGKGVVYEEHFKILEAKVAKK